MAVFRKESGVCNGRGFSTINPNGLLAKFKAWIERTPEQGGPKWHMIDNQSELLTDPYIVVSDTDPAILTVNAYNISPSYQAPKFIKAGYLTSEAAYVRFQYYMWWDPTDVTKGRGLWGGHRLGTLDDGEFIYDFRGGAECMIINTIVNSSNYLALIDNFDGIPNFLEDETRVAVMPSGASAGSDVVVTLNENDELKFTENNWYYIYDFNGVSHVEYAKVTNVNSTAHTITLNTVTGSFAANSVIGSYPHRFYTAGSGADAAGIQKQVSNIPYYSASPGYVFPNQSGAIEGGYSADYLYYPLAYINPDDNNIYSAQKYIIIEKYFTNQQYYYAAGGMNRFYGQPRNCYIARNNSYALLQDGLRINSKEYLMITPHMQNAVLDGNNDLCLLVLNTESNA